MPDSEQETERAVRDRMGAVRRPWFLPMAMLIVVLVPTAYSTVMTRVFHVRTDAGPLLALIAGLLAATSILGHTPVVYKDPETGQGSVYWSRQFKAGRRLETELVRVLELPHAELCNELHAYNCFGIHKVVLGDPDAFRIGLYEPFRRRPRSHRSRWTESSCLRAEIGSIKTWPSPPPAVCLEPFNSEWQAGECGLTRRGRRRVDPFTNERLAVFRTRVK